MSQHNPITPQSAIKLKEYVLDNVLDAAYLIDSQLRFVYVNEEACRALGYSREELMGFTLSDINPYATPADAALIWEKLIEQGHCTFEARHRRRDGSEFPVEIRRTLFEYQGQMMQVALVRDISERKRLESALAMREASFRSLADNLPDNIARWDVAGRYLYINAVHERLLGKTAAEMIGKTTAEAFPDGRFAPAEAAIAQVVTTGQAVLFARQAVPVNGQTRLHDIHLVPERDASGQLVSVLGIGRDMTDIYHLQDDLAVRERELRALAESSPGMLGSFYARPDGSICMPYVSPNIEKLFGLTVQDINQDATALMALNHPDDAQRVAESIVESARSMSTWHEEFRILHPTLGERWMESHTNPEPHPQGGTIWYGHIHDITERKHVQQRKELLERAIDLSSDNIFLIDEQFRFHYVNEGACQSLGYTREELLSMGVRDIDPGMKPEAVMAVRKATPIGQTATFESQHHSRNGRVRPVELSATDFMEGPTRWSLVVARDITERQRHEQALRDSRDFLMQIMNSTTDPIFVKDRAHCWVLVNEAFCHFLGQPREALIGQSTDDFFTPEQSESFKNKDELAFTTGETNLSEESMMDAHGTARYYQIKKTPFVSANGQALLIGVMRDITELNEHRQRVHQMAFYDSLTALPNRALFNDRLYQMITDAAWHGQQAGIMLLDLDRFKTVNDTLGHPAGDQLLMEAAGRIARCVRTYDSVARLGGDEFAILLPAIRAAEDLGKIANKILEAFKEPFLLDGKEVFSSTSVGIAVYPDDSSQADDLIRLADAAMYFAKRSGRNNFRFYAKELTATSSEKLALESELRRALERDELELYYQPKIRLTDGHLVGSEALLRWNNPRRGMVPPDQFIGIAEDSGLIVDIGAWVLLEACRTASAWNGPAKPLHKVAINLSVRQFQTGDLLKTVRQSLAQTACQPEWIELEITESLLLDEDGEVQASLNAFQAMGISIAIDDFGTGYSALSYLARFPINTLKIDRSFINSITVDSYRAELVKAIISIARCLGQDVVAEGVETLEQAAFLQAHGCQMAQGYLYSKPVARTAFELLPRSYHLGLALTFTV